MKKPEVFVKECVGRMSDEDLNYLNLRFSQNLCGDLADCLDVLSRVSEVDKWLATAASADDFTAMVEFVAENVEKEYKRRSTYNNSFSRKRAG